MRLRLTAHKYLLKNYNVYISHEEITDILKKMGFATRDMLDYRGIPKDLHKKNFDFSLLDMPADASSSGSLRNDP